MFSGKLFLNVLAELRESWERRDLSLPLVPKLPKLPELSEPFRRSVDGTLPLSEDSTSSCSLKLSTLLCFFGGVAVSDPPTLDEDFSSDGGLSSIMSADANGGLFGLLNLDSQTDGMSKASI